MTAAAEHGRPPGDFGWRTGDAIMTDLKRNHLPRLVVHDVLRDAEGATRRAGTSRRAMAETATDRCTPEEGAITPAGRQPGKGAGGGAGEASSGEGATPDWWSASEE